MRLENRALKNDFIIIRSSFHAFRKAWSEAASHEAEPSSLPTFINHTFNKLEF